MFTQSKRRRPKRRGRSLAPALIIESLALLALAWWVVQRVPVPTPPTTPGSAAIATGPLGSESRLDSPKIDVWIANNFALQPPTRP